MAIVYQLVRRYQQAHLFKTNDELGTIYGNTIEIGNDSKCIQQIDSLQQFYAWTEAMSASSLKMPDKIPIPEELITALESLNKFLGSKLRLPFDYDISHFIVEIPSSLYASKVDDHRCYLSLNEVVLNALHVFANDVKYLENIKYYILVQKELILNSRLKLLYNALLPVSSSNRNSLCELLESGKVYRMTCSL